VRIAIVTLGCKVNHCDSEAIAEQFAERSCTIVPFPQKANIFIVNTCSVTGKSDYQSRQLIRRIHRDYPEAAIVVTGCYAQVDPQAFERVPGVFLVAGNTAKPFIADLVLENFSHHRTGCIVPDRGPCSSFSGRRAHAVSSRTRFFLKIQDGCNSRCSYCIIPSARGSSRSLPPEGVLASLASIAAAGFREAVLTGIHLGSYGRDLHPATTLYDLLKRIEGSDLPPFRLRLSSLEPNEIDERLMQVIASSSRICHHLHLPLQSGSDAILQAMNRPYRAKEYAKLVTSLVSLIPDLALGADVMVGFPGETEEQFTETIRLVESLSLTYLHVFPFSPRKGTPAAALPGRLHGSIVKTRAQQLRAVGRMKRACYYGRFLDTTVPVLFESSRDRATGFLRGFSRTYIPVLAPGPDDLMNREVAVRLTGIRSETVQGLVAENHIQNPSSRG